MYCARVIVDDCNLTSLILHIVFGKDGFKGKQKEIMEAAVQGADILVVAPTGMGKVCVPNQDKADSYFNRVYVFKYLQSLKRYD